MPRARMIRTRVTRTSATAIACPEPTSTAGEPRLCAAPRPRWPQEIAKAPKAPCSGIRSALGRNAEARSAVVEAASTNTRMPRQLTDVKRDVRCKPARVRAIPPEHHGIGAGLGGPGASTPEVLRSPSRPDAAAHERRGEPGTMRGGAGEPMHRTHRDPADHDDLVTWA